MAEDIVVKELLSEAMIDAGAALTRKLDDLGLPLAATFWSFKPEVGEWRLVVASPNVSTKGPRSVYETIDAALNELGSAAAAIPKLAASVLEADDELVQTLKAALPAEPGIGQMRFRKGAAKGRYVEDVLVYRLV